MSRPGRPEHGGRSAPRGESSGTAALFGDAPLFEPTPAAAQARLAAVNPAAYARSRNFLDGAVTRLSPYLTHGLLTLPEVLRTVAARHAIDVQHKLVYELGWREYFRHVWRHEGEGIFESLHEGPLPDAAYARTLPADLRRGATGVPVIDAAVRTLYATGWLHNHARMWLASYVVHLRKLHWCAGADWMFGHLLDGDLASNHLSWQWVAGTGSHKPYLFNADNVAKYAPGWASPGSVVDVDYETLDRIARSPRAVLPAKGANGANNADAVDEPPLWAEPPPSLAAAFDAPDPDATAGRDVWLMHPFALGEPPPGRTAIGVFVADFHRRWPWSEARWRFVAERLSAACAAVWWVDAATLAAPLAAARSVHALDDPHLTPWLRGVATLQPAPRLFADPPQRCASFSQFWSRVTKRVSRVQDLPGFADPATMPR